ncbi:MAG: ribonuclease PH [Deltaproteobacteria bacterium]|nr:ribonuclease PH [Deltaproteobacteria bacterium]
MRHDGRQNDELRPVRITPNYLDFATGSALVEFGKTRVLCTAMVEEKVPRWRMSSGKGWVTAEYSMLPGSTNTRNSREVSRGRPGGRTMEIQRLIGRSLRMATDMTALGQRAVWVDCDVLQADGGTRTASITGGFVALALAMQKLVKEGTLSKVPLRDSVAAVSCGVVDGTAVLDLPYVEDSNADVDMNFVLTGSGGLIEIQGTGEQAPFSRAMMDSLTDLAVHGCGQLRDAQQAALSDIDFAQFPGY